MFLRVEVHIGRYIIRECCMKCHSRTFEAIVLRLCTKDEMPDAEGKVHVGHQAHTKR